MMLRYLSLSDLCPGQVHSTQDNFAHKWPWATSLQQGLQEQAWRGDPFLDKLKKQS
jgi:hypothetical protein